MLRIALLLLFSCVALAAFSTLAQAQTFDASAGIAAIDAPGTRVANDINHQPQSLTGGAYLVFSGDYLFFHKTIGVEGEFVRRETQNFDPVNNLYFRPMFYDANAIWTRKFFKRFTAEVEGGMGVETTRFYTGGCAHSGNCYVNQNHLMADAGAGIKIYPLQRSIFHHIFLRPEGRFYLIRGAQEFSSDHAIRFGASIGYSFK
ncbi:MAG: hypothetical protein WCC04_16985 [Terriglobales bacterium]